MEESKTRSSSMLLLLFIAGLLIGSMFSHYVYIQQINGLKTEISNLKNQISKLWGLQNTLCENVTLNYNGTSLSHIYAKVNASVVLIRVQTKSGTAQGSGFIYNFTSLMVIITNYHVIHNAVTVSVTFSDGEGYEAEVLGKDPYVDLAILSIKAAPVEKFKPLKIVSSSTLKVGDPVIAVGNPYGLVGSMTTGIISALGRTITEEYAGGFVIANVIQTSAPINPGNSGGPLLNFNGDVIGITTAIVSDSQGLGFAIPSDTLLREIHSLVINGTYRGHSYLGVMGRDLNFETARELGLNITCGWIIVSVKQDGPSHDKLFANDVVVALNNTRIRNNDDLASFLEAKTLPGESLTLTIWRKNSLWKKINVTIILGERPPPSV